MHLINLGEIIKAHGGIIVAFQAGSIDLMRTLSEFYGLTVALLRYIGGML